MTAADRFKVSTVGGFASASSAALFTAVKAATELAQRGYPAIIRLGAFEAVEIRWAGERYVVSSIGEAAPSWLGQVQGFVTT